MPEGSGAGRQIAVPAGTQFMHLLGRLVDSASAPVGPNDFRASYALGNREQRALFHAPADGLAGASDRAAAAQLNQAQRQIIELQQAIDDLRTRSTTDHLTGVLTRGRIGEAMQQEALRLQRYGHPVTLAFIDLDRFKSINDHHGHGAGDEVLRGFGDVVRACMRTTDLVGRWGGEEFVVLLPNSGLVSGRLLSERIRVALAARAFAVAGHVTASFGVAELRPNEPVDAWIARADDAMYRAKHGGRNRVVADMPADPDDVGFERVDAGFLRLVWHKHYESGNHAIDAQHRGLFDDANTLLAAMTRGRHRTEVTALVDELIVNITAHFRDEEAIFRAAGYPAADAHARAHDALIERMLQLADSHADGDLAIGDLFDFLVFTVVARHIVAEDRKYFPWLEPAARPPRERAPVLM